MKKFLSALAISTLAWSLSANASVFDYSYEYNNGAVISGTLAGDLIGNYVQNITDVTVFANGAKLSDKPYYVAGLVPDDGGLSNSGWRVSPIQSLNSFAFTDSPDVREFSFSSFFVFDGNLSTGLFGSNSAYGYGNGNQAFGPGVIASDRPVNNSFSLKEENAPENGEVPEPATDALLGLGLFGFAIARRKSKKSQNA